LKHGAERWQNIGLIALGVALLFLVLFAKVPKSTELAYQLHKLGHPTVFALIALIIVRLSKSAPYLRALVGVLIAGAFTELLQIPLQRGASFEDIGRDLIGATAALSGLWLWRNRQAPRRYRMAALCVVATLLAIGPLLWCFAAYMNRDRQFPVLASFESPFGTYFLTEDVRRERTHRRRESSGEYALHAVPGVERTAGVGLSEPYPDWRGYDSLNVDVTNPSDKTLHLIVRVHDRGHNWESEDRFNGAFEVSPREREVLRIPLQEVRTAPHSRQMDMSHIEGIAVFTARESITADFLLSAVWLERARPVTNTCLSSAGEHVRCDSDHTPARVVPRPVRRAVIAFQPIEPHPPTVDFAVRATRTQSMNAATILGRSTER